MASRAASPIAAAVSTRAAELARIKTHVISLQDKISLENPSLAHRLMTDFSNLMSEIAHQQLDVATTTDVKDNSIIDNLRNRITQLEAQLVNQNLQNRAFSAAEERMMQRMEAMRTEFIGKQAVFEGKQAVFEGKQAEFIGKQAVFESKQAATDRELKTLREQYDADKALLVYGELCVYVSDRCIDTVYAYERTTMLETDYNRKIAGITLDMINHSYRTNTLTPHQLTAYEKIDGRIAVARVTSIGSLVDLATVMRGIKTPRNNVAHPGAEQNARMKQLAAAIADPNLRVSAASLLTVSNRLDDATLRNIANIAIMFDNTMHIPGPATGGEPQERKLNLNDDTAAPAKAAPAKQQ